MGMTPEQKKQYEEAAKEYAENNYFYGDMQSGAKRGFRAGCEHAHEKVEKRSLLDDAERKAHNRAIDEVENVFSKNFEFGRIDISSEYFKEELKKLMK